MKYNVDHVEIPVLDLKEAQNFFKKAFGWNEEIQEWDENYTLISSQDPQDVSLGLYKVDEIPNKGVTITFRSEDIDETLKEIEAAGGKITRQKYLIAPEVGSAAEFADPFGNIHALHQPPS